MSEREAYQKQTSGRAVALWRLTSRLGPIRHQFNRQIVAFRTAAKETQSR